VCVYSVATDRTDGGVSTGVLTPLVLIQLQASSLSRGGGDAASAAAADGAITTAGATTSSDVNSPLRVEVRWLHDTTRPHGASSSPTGLRPSGPDVHDLDTGGGCWFELDGPGKWVLEVGGLWQEETLMSGLMVFASEAVSFGQVTAVAVDETVNSPCPALRCIQPCFGACDLEPPSQTMPGHTAVHCGKHAIEYFRLLHSSLLKCATEAVWCPNTASTGSHNA
jgi:hypothetical protein